MKTQTTILSQPVKKLNLTKQTLCVLTQTQNRVPDHQRAGSRTAHPNARLLNGVEIEYSITRQR